MSSGTILHTNADIATFQSANIRSVSADHRLPLFANMALGTDTSYCLFQIIVVSERGKMLFRETYTIIPDLDRIYK